LTILFIETSMEIDQPFPTLPFVVLNESMLFQKEEEKSGMLYGKVRLKGTHRDHVNMFLITGISYKRIVN